MEANAALAAPAHEYAACVIALAEAAEWFRNGSYITEALRAEVALDAVASALLGEEDDAQST